MIFFPVSFLKDEIYILISKLKQWSYINYAVGTSSCAHTYLLDIQGYQDVGTILL